MKKTFLWFARIFSFIALFTIALQNTQTITFIVLPNFYWSAPLILVLCVFFGLGLLLGALLLLPFVWRQRRTLAEYRKQSVPKRNNEG